MVGAEGVLMKNAKDYKCSRCKKKAVVFVGLNDPDATQYPMCRKDADEWAMEVLLAHSKRD